MAYDLAGDAGTSLNTKKISFDPYKRLVDASSRERLTGYVSTTNIAHTNLLQKSEAKTPRARAFDRVYSSQALHEQLRREITAATEQASRMEGLAEERDPIALANATFSLLDSLHNLWELRNLREDDWGDLINLLQGALALEQYETFSRNQCRAIRTIVVEHLGSGLTEASDLDEVVSLLRSAGFDPFKTISATGSETFLENEIG